MFNYFTSWVWGAQEETDAQGAVDTAAVEHSTREEAGEWVVVTTGAEPSAEKGSKSGKSRIHDRVCYCVRISKCLLLYSGQYKSGE